MRYALFTVQGCSFWFPFWVCGKNPLSVAIQIEHVEHYVSVLLIELYLKVSVTFELLDDKLYCEDHRKVRVAGLQRYSGAPRYFLSRYKYHYLKSKSR